MTGSSLHAVVAALGGDLYDGGRRASVPAPGHSAADRSVSLLLAEDRVIAHGFGDADWRAALAELRRRGLIDADGRLTGPCGAPCGAGAPVAPGRSAAFRRAAAAALWSQGAPITATTVTARHVERRGVPDAAASAALRHHPAAPLSAYRPGRAVRPALLARIDDPQGRLAGVEVTYLDPSGRRAATLALSRKTVGTAPAGSAVRLAPLGEVLLVGEGVFSVLSAAARLELPGWALCSASLLPRWSPPAGVRRVVIAADRGRPGERAALALADRLSAGGVGSDIVPPPPPWADWNEAHLATASREAEEGRRGRR